MITPATYGQELPPDSSARRTISLKNRSTGGEPASVSNEKSSPLPVSHSSPSERKKSAPTIYGIFNKIDKNGDGHITGAENEAFLRQVDEKKRELSGAHPHSDSGTAVKPAALLEPGAEGPFSALA